MHPKRQPSPIQSTFSIIIIALLVCFSGISAHSATLSTQTLGANTTGEEIQAALDKMPQGGEVVLAAGTYQIRQPLILRYDHQVLRGSGPSTILFLADKANCPVVILGSPLSGVRHTAEHLRLADLFIDGNRKNQTVELWRPAMDGAQLNNNGVDVWNVNEVVVENVVCCRCRSGGLVTAEARHFNLKNFTAFDNQFDGLACYQTEDSRFSGLRLHDNVAAGISLDLAFNHNIISDAQLTGNELGIFMRASHDNIFKALTISHSRKDGVFMAQTVEGFKGGWRLSPGTECSGNHFDDVAVNSCARNAFLINNASCINNVISGAKFQDNALGGLAMGETKPLGTTLLLAETTPAPKSKSAAQPIQAAIILPHAGTPTGH